MRYILFMMLALISANTANAQDVDPCTKFMPCGTYEGEGTGHNSDGTTRMEFIERWEISKVNAYTMNVKQNMFLKGENPEEIYRIDVDLIFSEDGTYTIHRKKDGSLFATGVCQFHACTFNFIPWEQTTDGVTKTIINVNTFRFSGNTLQRWMMVSQAVEKARLQTATLTKVK